MKKHLNRFLLIFLVFSMALPFHSMAATLNIFTTDGYSVGVPYKSLFIDEAGNTTAMTNGTLADIATVFTEPTITISNFVGCTGDNATGIVNGQKGIALSFNVVATDSAATTGNPVLLICLYPPLEVFSSGTFTNTYNTAGTNYATFEASITDTGKTYIAQRMVKINIVDPAQQNYTLTTSVSPTNAGTVSPASGTTYAPNTYADLTATANSNYTFSSWSGIIAGDTSSGNTARIYMSNNRTITANFTPTSTQNNTLTTAVSPTNAGTVSPASGTTYAPNTYADLTATANSNYTFSSWSGIASGDTTSGNTARIYMNTNRTITANFTATSTPPPTGETWVWDAYPMFWLNPGEEKVYIVNINQNYTYLKMSISGLTMNTMGTFTWTFPDGKVLPQPNSRQGVSEIVGMSGAGLLVLRAGNNIPDNPIPQGKHVLRISASVASSYFKISIEAQ